jgi:hypothetical protein
VTAPRLELRAADRWDLPNSYRASSGQFKATWTTIRDQLLHECEQLDARVVVVQLVIDSSGLRNDGKLRANAKVLHPGVKVSFESKHGPLTYATDQYERLWPNTLPGWQANLRAIGLGLQALRAVDRYGITKSGEQYRGFAALTAAPAGQGSLSVKDAIRILTAYPPYSVRSRDEVKAAFRAAMMIHHPDVGGETDACLLISRARDVLLAAVR